MFPKRQILLTMIMVFLATFFVRTTECFALSITDGDMLYAPEFLTTEYIIIENQKINIEIKEGYMYFKFQCILKNDAEEAEKIALALPYKNEEGLSLNIDNSIEFLKLYKNTTLASMFPTATLPKVNTFNVYRGDIAAGAKQELTLVYKQKYLVDKKIKVYIPKATTKAIYLGNYKVTLDSGVMNLADYSSVKITGNEKSSSSVVLGKAILLGEDDRDKLTISYKNTQDEITATIYKGYYSARIIADAIKKNDYKTVEDLTKKYLVASSTIDTSSIRNMIQFVSIEASYKNKNYEMFNSRIKDFDYFTVGSPQIASRMMIMQLTAIKNSGLSEEECYKLNDEIIKKFEKALPDEFTRINSLLIRNKLIKTKVEPIVKEPESVIDTENTDKPTINFSEFLGKKIFGISIGRYLSYAVIFIIGFILGIIFRRRKGKKNKHGNRTVYI